MCEKRAATVNIFEIFEKIKKRWKAGRGKAKSTEKIKICEERDVYSNGRGGQNDGAECNMCVCMSVLSSVLPFFFVLVPPRVFQWNKASGVSECVWTGAWNNFELQIQKKQWWNRNACGLLMCVPTGVAVGWGTTRETKDRNEKRLQPVRETTKNGSGGKMKKARVRNGR